MGFLGRLIAKPIFLKLGKGLRSKKKQLCLGEELDLELDESITGKDNVTGPATSKPQSFARWTDSGGTRLTDSKTIQDNDGNTSTVNEYAGELTQLIDNLSGNNNAAVVQHLRSLIKTMIRQEIKEKQIWDTYIDATSKSYVVRGQNLETPFESGIFFQINNKGIVTKPLQPRGLLYLQRNVPNISGNDTWYRLGTIETWTVLKDIDNVFVSLGGSASNPLKAVIRHQGGYQFKLSLRLSSPGRAGALQWRILIKGREYYSFGSLVSGLGNGYLADTMGFDADAGDELIFEFFAGLTGPALEVGLLGTPFPSFTSVIYYYLMG